MARKKSSKTSNAAGNQATTADTTASDTTTTLQDQVKPVPEEVSQIDARGPLSQQQQEPVPEREEEQDVLPVERASPRRYEDDNDDEDHHPSERARLIRTYSSESGTYSDGAGPRTQSNIAGQREAGVPEFSGNNNQPTTWWEWAEMNGLHPRTWSRQTYIKAGLLITLLTLIILSFTVFRIQDHIKDILRYIDGHKRIGALLFIASYTVACTLFLPGSLFTVGAGFLFKPFPLALLIVLLGDVFAAVGSFIFGRYVFYDWVKGMVSKHPKFNALDQVIQDDGWKIVVMLRLTPLPFSLITYFFSITSIRLWTVVWATCIGVFPGSCIGIWIGSLLKGLSGIDNPELERKNVVILAMNGIFIACCILTLSLFGKRSLRKAMKRLDQHQALTNLQEVEVVIEGVATVIRELEDNASIPPSLRSTMIEQLAAEENDQDYFYRNDLESAHRRLSSDEQAEEGESSTATSSTAVNNTVKDHQLHHRHNNKAAPIAATARPALASSGFTRGEKWTFVVIAVVAVLNICICVPLYYHFAKQDE
ncbi:hypothetical protein BGZ95_000519 [Linnemannia exigua]|uniref:VTT domain-containing protein n=1 Tax=Linnemannia exigua TaxID=604196 RepID=A0AAD4D844_9FUNG|nr:hypothetical protein BGZ95_000519 [Linnemannia exigua]